MKSEIEVMGILTFFLPPSHSYELGVSYFFHFNFFFKSNCFLDESPPPQHFKKQWYKIHKLSILQKDKM